MTFNIQSKNGGWVDIVPYIAYQGLTASLNSVDGSNAGRVLEQARMERDLLAYKHKWEITTRPIKLSVATQIEQLLMPEFFRISTDYYTPGTNTLYTVYSNNVTKAYIINKSGEPLVKLSFPIVER